MKFKGRKPQAKKLLYAGKRNDFPNLEVTRSWLRRWCDWFVPVVGYIAIQLSTWTSRDIAFPQQAERSAVMLLPCCGANSSRRTGTFFFPPFCPELEKYMFCELEEVLHISVINIQPLPQPWSSPRWLPTTFCVGF